MPAPVVIMVAPQMGENIGAAARAMANFGLNELRLVAPRDGWPNERAEAMATGAVDVVRNARVFAELGEAVADLHRLYAVTARPRHLVKPVLTPREAASEMVRSPGGLGLMFGAESSGLANDDVTKADAIITIPVGGFKSLNVAQAVVVVCYEYFVATGAGVAKPADPPAAAKGDILALFAHLEHELDRRHFFFPEEKRPAMVRNLRNLLQRKGLSEQDVRTLRGVIKALASPPKG